MMLILAELFACLIVCGQSCSSDLVVFLDQVLKNLRIFLIHSSKRPFWMQQYLYAFPFLVHDIQALLKPPYHAITRQVFNHRTQKFT